MIWRFFIFCLFLFPWLVLGIKVGSIAEIYDFSGLARIIESKGPEQALLLVIYGDGCPSSRATVRMLEEASPALEERLGQNVLIRKVSNERVKADGVPTILLFSAGVNAIDNWIELRGFMYQRSIAGISQFVADYGGPGVDPLLVILMQKYPVASPKHLLRLIDIFNRDFDAIQRRMLEFAKMVPKNFKLGPVDSATMPNPFDEL